MKYLKCKLRLDEIQKKIHQDTSNQSNFEVEKDILDEFKRVRAENCSYLQQKNKIKWIQLGDDNTAYFYRSLKVQQYRKRILEIKNCHDVWCYSPESISEDFVEYYEQLLGTEVLNRIQVNQNLIRQGNIISNE